MDQLKGKKEDLAPNAAIEVWLEGRRGGREFGSKGTGKIRQPTAANRREEKPKNEKRNKLVEIFFVQSIKRKGERVGPLWRLLRKSG